MDQDIVNGGAFGDRSGSRGGMLDSDVSDNDDEFIDSDNDDENTISQKKQKMKYACISVRISLATRVIPRRALPFLIEKLSVPVT
jgi:hypothetical protein